MTTYQEHPDRQGARIVARLGGKWNGHSGLCRCPAHADRSPSLSVRLGDHGLLFTCFAGCERAAVIAALRRHGLLGSGLSTTAVPLPRRDHADRKTAELLRWIWDQSIALPGTIAETYLRRRGIGITSAALRFQPNGQIGSGRSAWHGPALIAAVREKGRLVALQRTFLAPDGSGKAAIDQPRRMLGEPGRGAVQLAEAGTTLGLAEGIESALSATELLGIPVWASLGTRRFADITIPEQVTRLVLLADPDKAGRAAAADAAARLARPGLRIVTHWPDAGTGDWNDVAQAGRGEGAALM